MSFHDAVKECRHDAPITTLEGTHAALQDLHVGEFVLSNELVSMTLAMVSESREVNTILTELFTPNGNELYVLPAARFLGYAATS